MVSRRLLLGATILCLLIGALGVAFFLRQRIDRCTYVPLLAEELLPNADLAIPDAAGDMPAGWGRAVSRGVQLRHNDFDLDGDGRSLQLLGIANAVSTPAAAVRPGATYCFSGFSLTDSPLLSPTRARLVFVWLDSANTPIDEQATLWQPVRLWRPENPPRDWSPLLGAAVAPVGAAGLRVRIEPASDDRVYLDVMHLRRGGGAIELAELPVSVAYGSRDQTRPTLQVAPWPDGRAAAVAFSFDWETTMGGLIHSFSAGDPNVDQDPVERGLRMRQGITTTVELFRPLGVRASYFANGYNFLAGNPERRSFLGDPTFEWASAENGWSSDRWAETPWFADDPYGTVASDPAWYFGDLIDPLLAAGHEIQSHTFSHFYGGYVDAAGWRDDLATWDEVAAAAGVPAARAIAFPWSSSAGMSDANWDELERAGISAVTRTSGYEQYNLFPADESGLIAAPRCRWLPGREERILACPDFYLTEASANLALEQIDLAIAAGGMIDLWAHTEEVVTPAQIAAWERVVRRAASDERLWVAPFTTIADWQAGLGQVRVEPVGNASGTTRLDGPHSFMVTNGSGRNLSGLTLTIPEGTTQISLNGDNLDAASWQGRPGLTIDLAAGQAAEVTLWPAP